jgi:hypothetical protein
MSDRANFLQRLARLFRRRARRAWHGACSPIICICSYARVPRGWRRSCDGYSRATRCSSSVATIGQVIYSRIDTTRSYVRKNPTYWNWFGTFTQSGPCRTGAGPPRTAGISRVRHSAVMGSIQRPWQATHEVLAQRRHTQCGSSAIRGVPSRWSPQGTAGSARSRLRRKT